MRTRKAEAYLRFLLAAPIFLGYLDNLNGSGLVHHQKARFHLKGLIAELEKIDKDVGDIWKVDPISLYFSQDGFENCVKFLASLDYMQLQAIGRHGLQVSYDDEDTPPTTIPPSKREDQLQTI